MSLLDEKFIISSTSNIQFKAVENYKLYLCTKYLIKSQLLNQLIIRVRYYLYNHPVAIKIITHKMIYFKQVLVGRATIDQIRPELLSGEAVIDEIFNSIGKEVQDEVNLPPETMSQPMFIGIARNLTSAGRPSAEFYIR